MKKIFPFFVMILLPGFFCMSPAWSTVYKCEDDFGRIKFSDEPCAGGESSSRIDWLKSSYKKSSRRQNKKSRAKASRKKINTSEPVVLVTLLTTTQLQLKTETLTSSRGDENSEYLELVLPDGIKLDLTRVKSIHIKKSTRTNEIIAQIVMRDGVESLLTITRPYPVISADINIGRFSKSLQDIKTMEFFNSDKLPPALLQKRKPNKTVAHNQQQPRIPQAVAKGAPDKQDVPVIELDLSAPAQSGSSVRPVAEPKIKTVPIPYRQGIGATANTGSGTNTEARTPPDSGSGHKKTASRSGTSSQHVTVTLVNKSHLNLQKNSMGSQRGSTAVRDKLILSNNVQIPYKDIKQIKVRPTSDKSAIVVAVHLLTGEIKMENMSQPFTLLNGRSGKRNFSRSLLDIKSVRF